MTILSAMMNENLMLASVETPVFDENVKDEIVENGPKIVEGPKVGDVREEGDDDVQKRNDVKDASIDAMMMMMLMAMMMMTTTLVMIMMKIFVILIE